MCVFVISFYITSDTIVFYINFILKTSSRRKQAYVKGRDQLVHPRRNCKGDALRFAAMSQNLRLKLGFHMYGCSMRIWFVDAL